MALWDQTTNLQPSPRRLRRPSGRPPPRRGAAFRWPRVPAASGVPLAGSAPAGAGYGPRCGSVRLGGGPDGDPMGFSSAPRTWHPWHRPAGRVARGGPSDRTGPYGRAIVVTGRGAGLADSGRRPARCLLVFRRSPPLPLVTALVRGQRWGWPTAPAGRAADGAPGAVRRSAGRRRTCRTGPASGTHRVARSSAPVRPRLARARIVAARGPCRSRRVPGRRRTARCRSDGDTAPVLLRARAV